MRLDEDTLRALLREEADTVRPTGDGLSRIQERVAGRRSRLRWARPAFGALAAVVLLAGGTVAYTQLSSDSDQSISKVRIGNSPTPDGSAPSTPAPTTTPDVTTGVPVLWPTTAAYDDPKAAAADFVQKHLGMPQLDRVTSSTVDGTVADVGIGRRLPSETKQVMTATVVHLVQRDGAWYVQSASANQLSITDPEPGDSLPATSTVRGLITGVDEVLTVSVFGHADGQALGSAKQGIGGDNSPWSVNLSFTPPGETSPVALVAWTDSALDGAPARVTVTPVITGGPVGQPLSYPSTFYAARDGRIAQLSSKDGSVVRYLTTKQPGGGDSDPQIVGDQVYFLRGTGSCGNALMSLAFSGNTPTSVYAPSQATIGGYGISPDGTRVAMTLTGCGSSSVDSLGPNYQSVMVRDLSTGASHQTEMNSMPPMVVGNPVWTPDGTTFAGVLRTGNEAGVRVWPASLKTIDDGAAWCGSQPQSGLPQQVAYRPDGALLVAALTGDGVSVSSCTPSTETPVFAIPGAHAVTGLDATDSAVVIGTGDNDVQIVTGTSVKLTATGQSPTW